MQAQTQRQNCSIASVLLERYRSVRAATLVLTAPLSPEDMMVQSCAEASPAKWHLAHTTWFFESFVLHEFLADYGEFHPDFRWLFNSYYNALGEMPEKCLRANFSRPPLSEILAYRSHVDAAIERLLEQQSGVDTEALRRIVLGLNHEQQHQELIATDIKHALFSNPLHPAYSVPTEPPADTANTIAPPLDWVAFNPGLAEIGFAPTPEAGGSANVSETLLANFSFDNETPRHTVYLAPFSLATRTVTCAEYLAFIEDGGYARAELWLSEGWITVREQGWQAPLYWQRSADTPSDWRIYTLHGWQPLDELSETPVCHLSFFEADAYAHWAAQEIPGARLPTEFEWEFAASQRASATPTNLLESGNLHPRQASAEPGLRQTFGDVWEWTASAYTGYPGYYPLPGALGEYNGKFMSSQMVLRGGSCVTPTTHIRATYRNYFAPATRWQFSGLRLARDGAR